MNDYSGVIKYVKDGDNFLIFTHPNMDGDAMGSSVSLCKILRKVGKKAFIFKQDAVPDFLEPFYAPNKELFSEINPYGESRFISFAVDCNDSSRVEESADIFNKGSVFLCLDHHICLNNIADASVIDPSAASASLVVFEFAKAMNFAIDKDIADYLYLGLCSDTGCFMFNNTDARAHLAAAELFEYGIDYVGISNKLFSSCPEAELKIQARSIDNAKFFADGKLVISYITQQEMKELGGNYDFCASSIDRLRIIKGVEVAVLLKEDAQGRFKASIRSKNYADVNAAAMVLGGGGHRMAAGCTLSMKLEDAIESIKREIIKVL